MCALEICSAQVKRSGHDGVMVWESAGAAYDRVAPKYESRFVNELAGKARDRQLLDQLSTASCDPVIDVGCGPGQVGAYVRGRGRIVFGVDLSRAMAQLAAARLDGALAADMRALPVADGAAGALIAFYSVIHLQRDELGAAFEEFARVLRPGGQLVVSAHEGDGEVTSTEMLGESVSLSASFFALDELTAATEAAGFDIVSAERRDPYPTESQSIRLYVAARRPTSGS